MDATLFITIVLAAIAISYVNMLIGGGGGLVLIPFLIFLGLTPQQAVATGISAFVTATIPATYKFWRGKQLMKSYLPALILFGTTGALLGAFLLVHISNTIVEKLIAVALLLVVPLTFIKDMGLERKIKSRNMHSAGWIFIFFACFFAAMTGGGGGLFVVYTAVFFFGFTFIQGNANAAPIWFFSNIVLAIFFLSQELISLPHLIPLMIGNTIGAYAGAHTAVKKGNKFVKTIFSIVVILLAIKLLFF